ncbi:MAG TPA: nucleotidyltransferase domain-containing protein [Nanoarchaeota archaeon]|nr:nucleotidyltransferase domain-containing protein [Nanoarchaeota archaeon]
MDNIIQKHPALARTLLKYADREFTIRELARESGTPYATAWREVQALDKYGIILTKKIGTYTICKLNKVSPYMKTLKVILEETPHRLAFELFKSKIKHHPNIKKIYLFGSVAKGEEKPSSDVDVAIIVKKHFKKFEKWINKTMTEVLEKTQINLVPLVFTHKTLPKHFKKEIEKGELAYERD